MLKWQVSRHVSGILALKQFAVLLPLQGRCISIHAAIAQPLHMPYTWAAQEHACLCICVYLTHVSTWQKLMEAGEKGGDRDPSNVLVPIADWIDPGTCPGSGRCRVSTSLIQKYLNIHLPNTMLYQSTSYKLPRPLTSPLESPLDSQVCPVKPCGRSFSVVTPQLWNSLPLKVCKSWSLNIFWKHCNISIWTGS